MHARGRRKLSETACYQQITDRREGTAGSSFYSFWRFLLPPGTPPPGPRIRRNRLSDAGFRGSPSTGVGCKHEQKLPAHTWNS